MLPNLGITVMRCKTMQKSFVLHSVKYEKPLAEEFYSKTRSLDAS